MTTTATGAAPKRRGTVRILFAALLSAIILAYLGFGAVFYFQQDQMTFPAPAQYTNATPADVGIAFEDLHLPVAGSGQIHAWWIPAAQASDKTLLMFHGNGYVLEQTVGAAGELTPLHRLGTNLLFVDYRGYGSSSPGIPNETRVYEDARAALDYLLSQRHVPIHNVFFMGRSIGTGPATQLALGTLRMLEGSYWRARSPAFPRRPRRFGIYGSFPCPFSFTTASTIFRRSALCTFRCS